MLLRQIKYFMTTAEYLNFTVAAHKLNIAQPSISQQISELEKTLGFKLFKRNSRSVELTDAGAVFLTDVKDISYSLDNAILKALKAQKGQIGELRIAVIDAAVTNFLPNIIRLFKEQYPEILITIEHMNPLAQIKAFQDGKIDIGFSRSLNHQKYDNLEQHIVYKDKIVAVLPQDHFLANRNIISISELKNDTFIFFNRKNTEGFFDLVMRFCQDVGNFYPQVGHEPNLLQTLFLLVESGLGVSLIPACARHVNNRVKILDISEKSPDIPLIVLYKKNNISEISRSFISIFNDNIKTFLNN